MAHNFGFGAAFGGGLNAGGMAQWCSMDGDVSVDL